MKSLTVGTMSSGQVAKLAGISLRQLQWWSEQGIAGPQNSGIGCGTRREYDRAGAFRVLVIAGLRERRVSVQRIDDIVHAAIFRDATTDALSGSGVWLAVLASTFAILDSEKSVIAFAKDSPSPVLVLSLLDLAARVPIESSKGAMA